MKRKKKSVIQKGDAAIALAEGGKSQAKKGDVQQIRKETARLCIKDPKFLIAFLESGLK